MSDVDAAHFRSLVAAALPHALGDGAPGWLVRLADPERYGSMDKDSAITFKVALAADERPRVQVRALNDDGHAREIVTSVWPEAGAWIDRFPGADLVYEVDGGDELVLSFGEIDGVGGVSTAGLPADAKVVAVRVALPSERVELITVCADPEAADLPAPLHAAARDVLSRGGVGTFLIAWQGGAPRKLLWATEHPYTEASAEVVRALGGGPVLQALRDALQSTGLKVRPYVAEWATDGSIDLALWGIGEPPRPSWDVPDIFHDGVLPTSDAWSSAVALTVESNERPGVVELVDAVMYPGLAATVPPDTDPSVHARAVWSWLFDKLASEPPADRLVTLRVVSYQLWAAGMAARAFHLGLQRYLLSHPDVMAPGDETLPADVRAMGEDDVKAAAEALLPRARELDAWLPTVDDLPGHMIPGVQADPVALLDTLERAVSGVFIAASGRLHDWLMEYGPGGYDDDPTAMGIEELELDPGASYAAIEEALANDDER